MDPSINLKPTAVRHVVAMPLPGRGHINPMMNLCKLIASKTNDVLVTFVVTEEWLGFIGSDAKPDNLGFASIPNVIPSELVRGVEFPRFYEAVMTKMEVPFEQLLDRLDPPVTNIITDSELFWAIRIGNCRNIPVASLCTTSATFFSKLHYFGTIQDQHSLADLLGKGDEILDIPAAVSSTDVSDIRTIYGASGRGVMQLALKGHSWVQKSQYLLFNSVYELEAQVFGTLETKFSFPIYPIGPVIPYFELKDNFCTNISPDGPNYQEWLNFQPTGSVLYVSLGSFHSVSSEQMDEISAGLKNSGVRYLWVARGETCRLQKSCGDMGLVVPWCDQLKVLCHSSVGGFWTHCGWNSTLEALFAGIPMITFPITYDQVPNSEKIVQDWKIGWRLRGRGGDENSVSREEIAEIVQKFMDKESIEVQEMRKRARKFREICDGATAKGGTSGENLDAFIKEISQGHITIE
ncbi:UDP-glycosyltransferase 87A1-like [Pistacia vera]|uniref:UDP-glycosyltransferase 87A1-like n=1 Tax=Pistacia vera TaxID=55513 RepID=UPI001262E2D9|nr:UDP-glycosyltransferase 87A1-like [Pistacia vera]